MPTGPDSHSVERNSSMEGRPSSLFTSRKMVPDSVRYTSGSVTTQAYPFLAPAC
jgi:hypothetical protein